MTQSTILHTGRASLCALGASLRRRCCFAPLRAQRTMAQTTVRYRPLDQVLDALVGIRCGAKPIAPSNGTMRTDPAVPRACGRTACADQATLARPRRAGTGEHVAPLARVSWDDLTRAGATPHHRFAAPRLWVDIERTPRPMGATAEGRARPWRGRHRRTTGRKTLRITARQDRDSRHETWLRGKETAGPAWQAARVEPRWCSAWMGALGPPRSATGSAGEGSRAWPQAVRADGDASEATTAGRGSAPPAPGGRSPRCGPRIAAAGRPGSGAGGRPRRRGARSMPCWSRLERTSHRRPGLMGTTAGR